MARIFRNFKLVVTPDKNPNTLVQFVIGANQRVVVPSINIKPLGSTGSSIPLHFEFVKQTNGGTMVSGASNLHFVDPVPDETPVMTVLKQQAAQTEPSGTTEQGYDITVHQQQNVEWIPTNPFREVWMLGGDRWGLRYVSASPFIAVVINIPLEE